MVTILGISIGLALSMLAARTAVQEKIASVKSSIGNTITISPAGMRGFEGGGEPLTSSQIDSVRSLPHVVSVSETLTDRLGTSSTNLATAVDAGSLGERFAGRSGIPDSAGSAPSRTPRNFTPPITSLGSSDLTNLQSFGGGEISIIGGGKFDPAVDAEVALLGKDLAEKNSLSVGSTFQAYDTAIQVEGIFDAGNSFSNNMIILPLRTIQRLSGQVGNITSAIVQVDDIDNAKATVSSIQEKLGAAADVVSQQDTSGQALSPLESIKNISTFSLLGALIAGAVVILLTMLMIVRERRREIGVLKAIGATDFVVITQFVAESITLTIISAAVGTVVGLLASSPITRMLVENSNSSIQTVGRGMPGGRMMGFIGESNTNWRNIQASVGWEILLYGLVAAIVIAFIGSVVPAWMVSRVRPAEVMRSE